MAINFPGSPATNDTYTFGGRTWMWNGTAWISINTSISAAFLTANLAYAAANSAGGGADATARVTANLAFAHANAAFLQANSAGGGTIVQDYLAATRYIAFVDAISGAATQSNVSTSFTFTPSSNTLSVGGRLIVANTNPDPGFSAHIEGNVKISSTGTALLIIEGDSDNISETDGARILFVQDGGLTTGRIGFRHNSNDLEIVNDEASQDVRIGTANIFRLIVDGSGNVSIGNGVISSTHTLEVLGTFIANTTSTMINLDDTGLLFSRNNTPSLSVTGEIAEFNHDANSYAQVHLRNANTGTKASGDIIVTADVGTDSTDFIDLGINNSGFVDPAWTINNSRDGYLYTSHGNLAIGTANTSNNRSITFFVGGTLAVNERARIDQTGNILIGRTDSTVGLRTKLDVNGAINASAYLINGSLLTVTVNIGNGTANTFNITHNKNSFYVIPAVRENSTGYFIYPDMKTITPNHLFLEFVAAPSTNQYTVIVSG